MGECAARWAGVVLLCCCGVACGRTGVENLGSAGASLRHLVVGTNAGQDCRLARVDTILDLSGASPRSRVELQQPCPLSINFDAPLLGVPGGLIAESRNPDDGIRVISGETLSAGPTLPAAFSLAGACVTDVGSVWFQSEESPALLQQLYLNNGELEEPVDIASADLASYAMGGCASDAVALFVCMRSTNSDSPAILLVVDIAQRSVRDADPARAGVQGVGLPPTRCEMTADPRHGRLYLESMVENADGESDISVFDVEGRVPTLLRRVDLDLPSPTRTLSLVILPSGEIFVAVQSLGVGETWWTWLTVEPDSGSVVVQRRFGTSGPLLPFFSNRTAHGWAGWVVSISRASNVELDVEWLDALSGDSGQALTFESMEKPNRIWLVDQRL